MPIDETLDKMQATVRAMDLVLTHRVPASAAWWETLITLVDKMADHIIDAATARGWDGK